MRVLCRLHLHAYTGTLRQFGWLYRKCVHCGHTDFLEFTS